MLVLSRKSGEKIRIGEGIVLLVKKISGNRVSIGIEAPRTTKIVRDDASKGDSNVS